MSKEKFYTDEYGNKINVNTIAGFSAVLNDVFSDCNEEIQCDCLFENIEEILKKVRRHRILEITDIH